ncbi:MAG: hypothetical protein IJH69_03130, partial [Firmicutes bacterium]|nr:hypothetical protein [Bacillota bacterium]
LKVKVFHVTDGKDPDEFAKAHGRDAFMKLVKAAPGAIQYKLDSVKKGFDLSKDEEKLDYIKKAAAILRTLSPVETDIYVRALAEELKVSERAIFAEISAGGEAKTAAPAPERRDDTAADTELSSVEANVISALLTNPDLTEVLFDNFGMMENTFAKKIGNIILELFGTKGNYSISDINDRLDPDESLALEKAVSGILLAGREEEVLRESIRKWKLDKLFEMEKDIVSRMDLADESGIDQDMMKTLTNDLIEVQKEIKKYGGR